MTNTTQKTTFITQEQFAKALIQRIDSSDEPLSADVSERLRFARDRALQAQKITHLSPATSFATQAGGSAVLGGGHRFGLFSKWGSLLPLLALVIGMIVINQFQNDYHAKEMASIDSALLTDDLPPTAYADQGFGQFLKSQVER